MRDDTFVVVCNNIRSVHNVGSVFRTADGAGVGHVYLCGYTATPPRPDLHKVALGAEEHVPWTHRKSAARLITNLKKQGYEIVALENHVGRERDYRTFSPKKRCALVIGHEVDGITTTILKQCDTILEIPMRGSKESLNVSVAFGIVAYHIANAILE